MTYNSIGRIVATYGLQGEMVLHHHLGKKSSLKGLNAIFIEEQKNEMLPYFIESSKIKTDDEILIKLEGIPTREAARRFIRKEIWLREEDFSKYAAKSAAISLLGFYIMHEGSNLGEILEVIEQPHQVLCRIDLNGKEALIPVHAETLEKIDKKKKLVFLRLPEGLLEIFR